jgi:hypothetical protein
MLGLGAITARTTPEAGPLPGELFGYPVTVGDFDGEGLPTQGELVMGEFSIPPYREAWPADDVTVAVLVDGVEVPCEAFSLAFACNVLTLSIETTKGDEDGSSVDGCCDVSPGGTRRRGGGVARDQEGGTQEGNVDPAIPPGRGGGEAASG